METVLQHLGDETHPVPDGDAALRKTITIHQAETGEEEQTYGIFSTETMMADRNLSVMVFMFLMEASSLVRTSSWLMACSGVTS